MDLKLFPAKRIKQEPPDLPVSTFAYDEYGGGGGGNFSSGECFDHLPPPKHSASPAQEATRARINTVESQLNRLYRLQSVGKLDHKGVFQIRCLEEDLRKAHSKLRRLLNEAERQRRRRERLRGYSTADDAGATVPLRHGYPQRDQSPDDQSIMAALHGCAKFEDFVRELHSFGFSLARMKDQPHVFDIPEDSENGAEEVKVHVELIEGDVAFESNTTLQDNEDIEEIKLEQPPSPQHSEEFLSNDTPNCEPDSGKEKDLHGSHLIKTFADEYARKHVLYISEWQSQHQDWFERQVEAQQQWEENFVRKQMDLAKSILESSTTAFLQGIQQVMQNVVGHRGRRPITPFCPTMPRNFDFGHFNSSAFPDHQTTLNARTYSQSNSKLNGRAEK